MNPRARRNRRLRRTWVLTVAMDGAMQVWLTRKVCAAAGIAAPPGKPDVPVRLFGTWYRDDVPGERAWLDVADATYIITLREK